MAAIEVFAKDQLNDVGNGEYTVTVRADGSVLSVQPDGLFQTRPKGTAGPWERAVISGAGLIFRPQGVEGRTYFVPLATDWPNK